MPTDELCPLEASVSDGAEQPPCAVCGEESSPSYPLGNLCAPHAFAVVRLKIERDMPPTTRVDERPPVVYYWRFGDRIKIGTTRCLQQRLAALPPGELLATEPGGVDVERQRHRQFAGLRVAGREWFSSHPDLTEHIASLR